MIWSRIFIIFCLPSLLKAKTFAPFVRAGRVFRVKAVVDIQFEFDFSLIRESCANISATMSQSRGRRARNNRGFDRLVDQLEQEVENLCDDPIFSLRPHDLTQAHIVKRQAFLGGLAVGALVSYVTNNLFSSSSHSMRVEKHNFHVLDQEMQNLQEFVRDQSVRIENYAEATDLNILVLQHQAYLQRLQSRAKSASDGFISLLQGHLSHNVLSPSEAKEQLAALRALASAHEAHLPFDDVLSLFLFPVTHVMQDHRVSFTLSVPLVGEKYTNWRFLQAPMFLEQELGSAFLTPAPKNVFLAVPPDGDPVALSESDMSHCTHWEGDYFCTYLPNRRRDDQCLVSLFREPEEVLQTCDFSMSLFPEFVLTHLNENQFLLSLNVSSLSFEEKCKDNSSFGTYYFGQTLINVHQGCSVSTKLFDIPAYSSIQRSVRVRPFAPRYNGNFFKGNLSHLAKEFSLLQHIKLAELENETPLSHWPWHVATFCSVLTVVIVIFIVLRYVYGNRTRIINT